MRACATPNTWASLLTLLMHPVLVVMHLRLTRREEWDAVREFGDRYRLSRLSGCSRQSRPPPLQRPGWVKEAWSFVGVHS